MLWSAYCDHAAKPSTSPKLSIAVAKKLYGWRLDAVYVESVGLYSATNLYKI